MTPRTSAKKRSKPYAYTNRPSAVGASRDQVGMRIRFQSEKQLEHIRKAVESLDPSPSMNLFFLQAAVARANKILGYTL